MPNLQKSNNYRDEDAQRRKTGRPATAEEARNSFNKCYPEIYEAFNERRSVVSIAAEFGVSRQAAHLWKKSWLTWLEFNEEPPAIKELKAEATKKVLQSTQHIVLKEKQMKVVISRKHTEIDNLRLRFLDIANASLDQIETLIQKEKSVGNLAKLLGAVLPYVATKQDGNSDRGLSPDEKRTAFIQNVMNIYNINQKQTDDNGTTENVEPEWLE